MAQQPRGDEIARGLRAPCALDQVPLQQPLDPRLQGLDGRQLQYGGQFTGGHGVVLGQQAQGDAFALGELVGLVSLGDEIDDFGLEDTAAYRDLHAVVGFDQLRRRAALRQQHLEDLVEAAAFALHQLQVVEQTGKVLVATHGGVQHVLRRDAPW